MNKRTSAIALVLLIAAAVIFGYAFVNKGDGPVTGLILSDTQIDSIQNYKSASVSKGLGTYLVLEKEFNHFSEKAVTKIPAGKEVYASFYFVECPKGSAFTVKWLYQGNVIKLEAKGLATDRQGVISYLLEKDRVKKGSYSIELYRDGTQLMSQVISVK